MDTSKPRNRRKLKARAARWAALKTAISIEEHGKWGHEFMRGTDQRQPVGLLARAT